MGSLENNAPEYLLRLLNGSLCQCNDIAEFGEPFEQAICCFFGLDFVQVGVSDFLVRMPILPHVEGADEDGVPYGHDGTFSTAARRDPPKQSRKIGAFGVGCRPSCLSQRSAQPAISFARLELRRTKSALGLLQSLPNILDLLG